MTRQFIKNDQQLKWNLIRPQNICNIFYENFFDSNLLDEEQFGFWNKQKSTAAKSIFTETIIGDMKNGKKLFLTYKSIQFIFAQKIVVFQLFCSCN